MKKLCLFITVIFALFVYTLDVKAYEDTWLRDYDGIELAKGTFLNVINMREFSSLYCDLGYKTEFTALSNLYLNEINIIPRGSKFYGYIDLIHEPVIGTNASMRVKIVKLILPDGYEMPMKGYIYTSHGFLIGGEKTQPAKYIQKRSRMQGYPSRVGYVPGPQLKMGEHVTVASGAEMIICLTAPLFITHTVTD